MDVLFSLCNLVPAACLGGLVLLAGIWLLGFVALAVVTGGDSLGHIGSCEGCLLFPFIVGLLIVVVLGGCWLLFSGQWPLK